MLALTKEATDKDRSPKTQLAISSKSFKEKISGERVCGEMRDFLRIQIKIMKLNCTHACMIYKRENFLAYDVRLR